MKNLAPWLMFAAIAACDKDDAESSSETSEPAQEEASAAPAAAPSGEAPNAEVRALMQEHFSKARDARNALVAGDGDAARSAIQWLANNDLATDGFPEELRPRLGALRTEAGRFGSAEGLAASGEAYAAILVRCGECHQAAEKGPTFAAPPAPTGDGVRARMQLHRWAAERMFEGLVTADPELFRSGAAVLEADPLRAEELPAGDPEQIQAFANHVHTLGQEAVAAQTEQERAAVYGRFLVTCTACHRALGMGDVVSAVLAR